MICPSAKRFFASNLLVIEDWPQAAVLPNLKGALDGKGKLSLLQRDPSSGRSGVTWK